VNLDHDSMPEPSAVDLAAIDAEWPLIAAELDVLDAEITMFYADDSGGPSPLDWRRLRRAEARVTRTAAELAARPAEHLCPSWGLVEVGMTGCGYGCKILRCPDCGGDQVSHRAVYGCPVGQASFRAA